MADFAHLRRVIVSQRLTRGRRDFNTAALDFRAQQHLLSKSRVLDPDYAIKVLSPDEERESEKRVPGGYTKPPEIRFDPKATRKPGQILKLHVTAEDMLDESEKPNFGWVDPPAPVDSFETVRRLAREPKIQIREYDIDPRTGGADRNDYQDIELKSLGDKIGGGGRSLIGRAARKLGMVVDDLGKFRCPPGTPNANQFTDITGSTCFPSLGRVQETIDHLLNRMGINWGANPYHGVPDDVAQRIGLGWTAEEAHNLAQMSVAEQMQAGVADARRRGVRTVEQLKRHQAGLEKNVKKFATKRGNELPDDLHADPRATYKALRGLMRETINNGEWTNGSDHHGDPHPPPKLTITSFAGHAKRRLKPGEDGFDPDTITLVDLSDDEMEYLLTKELIDAVRILEDPGSTPATDLLHLDGRGVTRAEWKEYEKRGELYDAVEKLRENWLVNANGAMFAHLEMLDRDLRTGSNRAGVVGELVLGTDRHLGMGTGGITRGPGQPARITINSVDATFKQYYDVPAGKISQIISTGDGLEGKKWDKLHKFLKDQQHMSPYRFLDKMRTEHSQDLAEGMLRSRFAGAMQVTYHEYTHAQQHDIFFERVASKLSADGKYTIHKPIGYTDPHARPPTTWRDPKGNLRRGEGNWTGDSREMSLYPEQHHLDDPEFEGAEEGVAFSHWTNQDLEDAVVSEMFAPPDNDFPPGDMPLMKDSMLDLLAGQRLKGIRDRQQRGAQGWIDPADTGGPLLKETRERQRQRERLMYIEATAELSAQKQMGIIGGPVVDGHLSYLDAPARQVRAQHITEGQALINEVDFPEFVNPPGKPNRLRVVQANAEGRPIRQEDRAGPRIDSMHARGVGSRGDGVQVRALVNEEFSIPGTLGAGLFEDGPMDTIDADLLDARFRVLHNAFEGLDQDRELSHNEKIRMYLAARGMEQILNENARRANASDYYKDKLARNGKPIEAGNPLDGRWTDDFTRSLRSDTDELFDDLGGARVFQPPGIRETDEALSTHTTTRRAIMMGGLSEQQATAIDADLPAKHRGLTDPEKLTERVQLSMTAARYADDHGIEISTSPDEPSPHLDREIIDFITPTMKVIDDNPLPESVTVRVRDENDQSVRSVGDIIERDFTVGTASSHAQSDRHDRMEPGEGASFRIEMQAGDKGIHREDDVLLPPGRFEVTSIEDNGDIVLAPVSQQTGPQVLKIIEDVLDDMPAPLDHEEEHRRKMVYSAVRRGQAQAAPEEPEEIRFLYNAPEQMPLASVHREFNELGDRHDQRALTSREKDRLERLGRFLRIRSTGDPDLPDPDDPDAHIPHILQTPDVGLRSQRESGFRSSRADVDLDENGVHTDDSGIRMVHDRATGEWRHLKIRRNPVKDRRGRSLLQQWTGNGDEWEDLPLVDNGAGVMFQWDGERWRPDLSQVPEDQFDMEVGLVVEDGDGGFSRYDPVTETWSDYSVHARDIQHVPSKHNLRTNWRLRHTGFLMRDSRLGDPRPGASSDHREMAVPLPTDIMYHGSPEEFDEFMFGARLSDNAGGAKNPDSGLGFHFSPFEQTASGMGNHVKVVHIRMNNPVHIDDLQTVGLLRQRALISELGLDDVYEEAFTEYLRRKPELFDMLRGDESIMERVVDLPRNDDDYYDPGGFIGSFMDELKRVVKWHEYQKEHGRKPFQQSWQDFNDNGYGNPELTGLLTAEQLEDSTLMRFRSGDDPVGEEGIGTRNDEITREWIKSFGYDGLIIKEAYMGRSKGEDANQVGRMNSGDPRQSSYVVLDPDQITTADPPERTPAQLAAREKMRAHMASLEEHGIRVDNSNFAAKANDHFTPFDVRVTVGDEVLFEGGEPKPTNKTGHAIFEDLFWANHGEAAWQRDREKRSVDEIADEYLRVGGLASRRNDELKRSLGEQQERLTENMRARRRTQDPAELAELAEDFEYLAGIERSDRREFNRNNQIGLQSSRGSTDRNVRARMQEKDEERRVARRRVGGTTGDIFVPDDVFVEEATDPQRPLGGGMHDWTVDTRENKVGRALDSASGAIEHFRGGGGDGDVPLPKAVRRFIADNTDEEILDRLRQAAREYVSDFDPRIRVAAKRGKVDEILADPDRRIKSTHEAASDMSPADARRELELTWGIPLDAPADVRPVSGSLDHKEYRKLKAAWIKANKDKNRPNFRNTDPDFLPDYWGEIAPSGPATWVYGGGLDGGGIEFVLKADRANDSSVVFGDSALQGAKRPTGMTSTNADDLLAAILYPETTVSANHVGRNRKENRAHVMSLLNGSLTGDWSGVLDPDAHQRAVQQGVSPAQAAGASQRYAEALVPGGFDFEDVEHVSMPVGTFNVPDELAPGDLGRNNQELLDALASFNLSDTELDQLLSDYGSSGHHYATYMRNYLGMLEKKRELRKLGLETVFPNHDAIDYFDPATWLSLPPTAWGGTQPSPNSNVYELLQHLIRADIIRRRQTLVDTIRRPAPVYDPVVSVV